ncbi:hypothetical protein DMUE_3841 [Dictyocoela muelleri]|nr:hypothetical protein DMUE_3841 [Dictyocoela muelleri]
MVQADALSRMFTAVGKQMESDLEATENLVLQLNRENSHRKSISDILKRKNINVSSKRLYEIFKKCEVCAKSDRKNVKPAYYIKTELPGERMAFDILEVEKNKRIIVAIDYFSRYVFAEELKSKEAVETLEFIKNVYSKFNFKTLVADNGK